MHSLVLLSLFYLGVSCKNNGTPSSKKKDSTTEQSSNKKDKTDKFPGRQSLTSDESCYMQVLKRDTIVMRLEKKGTEISGRLSFDNYEKDGSSGTVRGWQDGEVIKLVYSFASEGSNSVMEVFFKVIADDLVRGVGDMHTRGDTVYFVHPESVNFAGDAIMKKLDCAQVPGKYK